MVVEFDGCDVVTKVTTATQKDLTLAVFLKTIEEAKAEKAFAERKATILQRMVKLKIEPILVEAAATEAALIEALKDEDEKHAIIGTSDNFRSYCRSKETKSA
jgi:hypothetical protein